MGTLAKNAPTKTASNTCSLMARAEDDADREVIRRIMADTTIPQRKVAQWLGCSSSTVAEHRAKACTGCMCGAA